MHRLWGGVLFVPVPALADGLVVEASGEVWEAALGLTALATSAIGLFGMMAGVLGGFGLLVWLFVRELAHPQHLS